ncbi:unnamed protein product [Adineta steineri]|uniref:Uncharacterized protein n=1 Tax=Adineta steineri TaxID=433720 RepID=A0A815SL66_9BILA|nr:unnamed protein product [Adineta steineri]
MAEMDVLQSKIIQQIEAYLTEDNLRNDYKLAKYEHENDGWIPIEDLNQFNKLSTYKYDTILNAINSKRSNIIELNLCEPICIRRRRQPLIESTFEQNPYLYQTVVVNGLPRDVKHEELMEFFNRFYPVYKIKMLSSTRTTNSFSGKIHVIFEKSQDAFTFVQRSEFTSIIYVNDYVLQLCNGYTLVCKLLVDCDDRDQLDLIKQTEQLRFRNGQSFSHRLASCPLRVSFNTNVSLSKNDDARRKSQAIISQTKSCLKSSTCATEQILFCQNPIDSKLSTALLYKNQPIVTNCFSYDFYFPDHLLQQTHECMIIAALNPHCFTIQLKQDAIEFDKFQREINDFYNTIDDKKYFIPVEQIQKNLCVICADPKSSDNDKIWNRSQILDFDINDQTVNLFYVDLGTWDEYVPINRLRYLIDSFHQHLVFSLTCRLAHISPIDNDTKIVAWPDDAIDQFLAVINQVVPEIELLAFGNDGLFQTNLFVINSGQYVCVNDYMIHIKKAKAILQSTDIDDNNQNITQSDKQGTVNHGPIIHPVIALYNQLGEILKRSIIKSRSTILNNSSISIKPLVKLIHTNTQINNIPQKLPLIFIHYEKSILIPDFNICSLLKMINSNIDTDIIEDYALTMKYQSIHITRDSNLEIFKQINISSLNHITLYTIDFIMCILEHHHFPLANIFLALENAKLAQIYASDLSFWFTIDNELILTSDNSIKLNNSPIHTPFEDKQSLSMAKRLPFSNRLISPT